MKSIWEDTMTKEQLELREELLLVLKKSDLPFEESWKVMSCLLNEFHHAKDHCEKLFTMEEIWNKYEAKLSQTTK